MTFETEPTPVLRELCSYYGIDSKYHYECPVTIKLNPNAGFSQFYKQFLQTRNISRVDIYATVLQGPNHVFAKYHDFVASIALHIWLDNEREILDAGSIFLPIGPFTGDGRRVLADIIVDGKQKTLSTLRKMCSDYPYLKLEKKNAIDTTALWDNYEKKAITTEQARVVNCEMISFHNGEASRVIAVDHTGSKILTFLENKNRKTKNLYCTKKEKKIRESSGAKNTNAMVNTKFISSITANADADNSDVLSQKICDSYKHIVRLLEKKYRLCCAGKLPITNTSSYLYIYHYTMGMYIDDYLNMCKRKVIRDNMTTFSDEYSVLDRATKRRHEIEVIRRMLQACNPSRLKRNFKSGKRNFYKQKERVWNNEPLTSASEGENPFVQICANRKTVPSFGKNCANLIRQYHEHLVRFVCPFFTQDGSNVGIPHYLTVGVKITIKKHDSEIKAMEVIVLKELEVSGGLAANDVENEKDVMEIEQSSSLNALEENTRMALFFNSTFVGYIGGSAKQAREKIKRLTMRYTMLHIVEDVCVAYYLTWGLPGYLYTRFYYTCTESFNITQSNYIFQGFTPNDEKCPEDRFTLQAVFNRYYKHNDGPRLVLGLGLKKQCASGGKTTLGNCFVSNSERKELLTVDSTQYGVTAKVLFMVDSHNVEDGIIVSESFARKKMLVYHVKDYCNVFQGNPNSIDIIDVLPEAFIRYDENLFAPIPNKKVEPLQPLIVMCYKRKHYDQYGTTHDQSSMFQFKHDNPHIWIVLQRGKLEPSEFCFHSCSWVVKNETYKYSLERCTDIRIGTKLANHHGQKGVVTKIVKDCQLPYHKLSGERPDLVISSVTLLGRCTGGPLCENSNESFKGIFHDPLISCDILNELEMYKCEVMLQRNDQRDKMHQRRDLNLIDKLTGLPLSGKQNDGSARLGEMECGAMIQTGNRNELCRFRNGPDHLIEVSVCVLCGLFLVTELQNSHLSQCPKRMDSADTATKQFKSVGFLPYSAILFIHEMAQLRKSIQIMKIEINRK